MNTGKVRVKHYSCNLYYLKHNPFLPQDTYFLEKQLIIAKAFTTISVKHMRCWNRDTEQEKRLKNGVAYYVSRNETEINEIISIF